MSPQNGESTVDFVKRVAEQLGEHFDVVQIFVQTDSPDTTTPYQAGYGNMYARAGQIERWLRTFDKLEELADIDDDEHEH